MSELMTEIEAIRKENADLKKSLHQLTIIAMKDKLNAVWLSEDIAASMLNLQPRTLRKAVKKGEGHFREINVRNTNGRNYQYSRKSLEKYQSLTSTEFIKPSLLRIAR